MRNMEKWVVIGTVCTMSCVWCVGGGILTKSFCGMQMIMEGILILGWGSGFGQGSRSMFEGHSRVSRGILRVADKLAAACEFLRADRFPLNLISCHFFNDREEKQRIFYPSTAPVVQSHWHSALQRCRLGMWILTSSETEIDSMPSRVALNGYWPMINDL
jgi:hypothetical protein